MNAFKLTYTADLATETFSGEFRRLRADETLDPFYTHALERLPTWEAMVVEMIARFRLWGGAADDTVRIQRLRGDGYVNGELELSPDTVAEMAGTGTVETLSYVNIERPAGAPQATQLGGFELTPGVFHAGRVVLAAAFGETVQVRVFADGAFECPVCGRRTQPWPAGECRASCDVDDLVFDRKDGFGSIELDALLNRHHKAPRFYFPFPWNPSSGWILRHELVALLEGWRREKAELP